MTLNPNKESRRERQRGALIGLDGAVVESVRSHTEGDDIGHNVRVKPDLVDQTIIADVVVTQHGDTAIPQSGDRVVIGYRLTGRPVVLGTHYTEGDTIPDFEPGERRIGHPASDSYVRLNEDGTIHVESDGGATVEIQADGDVVINGGSTKPVTDVTVSTTKDGDGDVQSVDLNITRTSDVFVP